MFDAQALIHPWMALQVLLTVPFTGFFEDHSATGVFTVGIGNEHRLKPWHILRGLD